MMAKQKVALITGAARRVGRAVALALAGAGYDVAFTYLKSAREAKSLVKQIEMLDRDALAIRADLARPAAASAMIHKQFTKKFGRLDVLVNNASEFARVGLAGTDLRLLERLNAIHVYGPLLLCQRFEKMLRRSRGSVVNMVDLLAERPWPDYLAYCASKAALANLTLGLARALAPQVTVNGIAPGVVKWPDDYPKAEREKYMKRIPLAREGTPEDVAGLVKFLVTDGRYITGQIIRLDGGRSIT